VEDEGAAMSGYTKLHSSILHSTIWRADDHTRLVFITLLAAADKDGVVEASVPGLADLARVPLDACEAALTALMAPDEYSRTSEHDGRRIEVVEGGWRLLNHAHYRAKFGRDDRRKYQRDWVRRKRESTPVDKSTKSIQAEAEAEAEAKSKDQERALDGFDRFWACYPRKVAKVAARKAWVKQQGSSLVELIVRGVGLAKDQPNWLESDRYVPHPATWLNGRRWEDEAEQVARGKSTVTESHSGHFTLDDWWADCKAKHDGQCAGRMAHGIRLDLDAAKQEAAS
jgi:hypothetical protein